MFTPQKNLIPYEELFAGNRLRRWGEIRDINHFRRIYVSHTRAFNYTPYVLVSLPHNLYEHRGQADNHWRLSLERQYQDPDAPESNQRVQICSIYRAEKKALQLLSQLAKDAQDFGLVPLPVPPTENRNKRQRVVDLDVD